MLRVLLDHDVKSAIQRGLKRKLPDLDLITAFEAGIFTKPDPEVLQWAAENGRIVITHDSNTMSKHAFERVHAGLPLHGVFIIKQKAPLALVLDHLTLLISCTTNEEWENIVLFLPLKSLINA